MLIERVGPQRALLPGYVRLARRIVYEHRGSPAELLWFDIPEGLAEGLDQTESGWLVALLPLALRRREPLRTAAPVDRGLLDNVALLRTIWERWYPEYPPVRIEAAVANSNLPRATLRTALFFTGGVDSFFSCLDWDSGHSPVEQVDDLLYIWGYDIPLSNRAAFERKAHALAAAAAMMGKRSICVASNLRDTRLGALNWPKVMHGAALAASALLLEGLHSTVLLSAALARDADESFGAHPLTDPLMSTSRTRFIHYGAEVTRFEKTARIAGSEAARRYLHVCWEDASDRNCGRCEKCFRTELSLDLLGVRREFTCFDAAAFSLERAASFRLATPATVRLMEDLRQPALDHGRPDALAAIDRCLATNRELNERYARSKWRRRARKWRNSFRKRWLSGKASLAYWLVTVAFVVVVALQFSDCFLDPEEAVGLTAPVHSLR
jgi:hypothetical protein